QFLQTMQVGVGPQHREFRKEILQAMRVGVNEFNFVKIGSGTEMIFSQNLFRRPTPARLTRIEKSLLQAHFRSVIRSLAINTTY
ncbi:hypothetical protein AAGX59_13745, partial [Staphylococcus aureus]